MVGKGDGIYLDYNATTPVGAEVLATIIDVLKNAWGNPSSSYREGDRAKKVIAVARQEVADAVNGEASDIIFLSGGTEANNWVISTAVKYFQCRNSSHCGDKGENTKPHIISTTVEHDSVSLPLLSLEKEGIIDVTFIPVNGQCGHVTADDVVRALRPTTCLVTIMMANNETGVVMPIKEICGRIQDIDEGLKPLIHTDAAQALGKIPVDVRELGVDYLTLVGHKFYGPRIGALYVKGLGKGGSPLYSWFKGGGQERNYRPGTENTPLIAGLGKAAIIARNSLEEMSQNMSRTRNYLEKRLIDEFGDGVQINCQSSQRLPNTSSVAFLGKDLQGYKLLQRIKGFSCSAGSACHSDECKPSSVLLNFHVPFDVAANTIRISTGRATALKDIDCAVDELKSIILT